MVLKRANEEQELTKCFGQRNVLQYDLLNDYDMLIASLWKCDENEWHCTKRLYNLGETEDLGEYECKFEVVVNDFLKKVSEWINDEIEFLRSIYNDFHSDDIPILH